MNSIRRVTVDAPTAVKRRRPDGDTVVRAGVVTLLLALTGWLAFSDGGFHTQDTSVAAVAVLVGLLLLITVTAHPFAGLSPWGFVTAGALTLFAIWTLVSATWSEAPARALIEFNRALLYLAAFLLTSCLVGGRANARWLMRVVALALGAAVLAALLSRLEPGLSAEAARHAGERLGWPLGYWNALGLAGAFATIACLHLSSDLREARLVRVLAAAAVPALLVTIYLTLSRGSIVAGAVGLAVLLILGRGRGALATLVAVIPCAAYALLQAYGAESLLDGSMSSPGDRAEAADVERAVGFACLAAAVLRALGLLLDARLARLRLWKRWSLRRSSTVVGGVAALIVVAGLAFGADSFLIERWTSFAQTENVQVEDQRDRLAAASANGRIEHWEVAVASWREEPARGSGAGTYAKTWARDRPLEFSVVDAHSLYLEVLAELGVVGLVLLTVALLVPLVALLRRRMEDRPLWSAVLALTVAWAVHAGIDWDWEMPALTLPVIALLGAACAREAVHGDSRRTLGRLPRLLAGLGILLLILTPVRLGLSQRYLDQSLTAFRAGDCATATEKALAAAETVDSRPQAFELLGYCDARAGRYALARRMLDAAQRRDPGTWDLHYGSALVRSVGGRDPRPELRRARRLNPLEDAVEDALGRMDSDRPRVWIREGLRTPLPLPQVD